MENRRANVSGDAGKFVLRLELRTWQKLLRCITLKRGLGCDVAG